jgi:hypothetical protein
MVNTTNFDSLKTVQLSVILLVFISTCVKAQGSIEKKSKFNWSAFLDTYYSYDFSKPTNHLKPQFLYNHNRHNEITINLALVNLSYSDSSKRANIGLMAGTYPQYNLSSEPNALRYVYEANVGIRISKNRDLWVDAGIMPSHIGFESAISKDCWTLTRSILAENSPYYEAGIKVSYKSQSNKWYLAALMLNGWQRMRRIDGNNTPAFGTQVTYTATDKLLFNSSSFIGNDKPDSAKQWRYFHNFYTTFQLSRLWGFTLGFDIGFEQKANRASSTNTWFSPLVILRYQNNNWALATRAEYYNDKNGVIVHLVNANPFKMQGYSLNIDRMIANGLLWRLEGRLLKNSANYFTGQSFKRYNLSVTASISFSFN